MSNELKASEVKWKRLRRLVYSTLFVAAVGGTGLYVLGGSSVLLDADGLVTRRSVAVASPWTDARISKISVRPGDWVEAGQQIAVVESASMARSLADLAAEQARVASRVAQLEGRLTVVKALLPTAKANVEQTDSFLNTLEDAQTRGLVVNRSMQTMTKAQLEAQEKYLTLQAEQTSLVTEISSNQSALQQVASAFDDLRSTYGNGVLIAPASGYVGSKVAMVGEVLVSGNTDVANIYTGPSYVLAYIPENYLFDVQEGQKVSVKGRGQVITGEIERVLPVTDALPPEFQLPNRVRGRGQLVRVALTGPENFAVDQKVELTSCYLENCRLGVSELVQAAVTRLQGNTLAAAQEPVPDSPAVQDSVLKSAGARPKRTFRTSAADHLDGDKIESSSITR